MSLKLNLGAGTFPLPFVRGEEPNPAHTLPLPDECYEPGWVNVDKFAHAGIQERINLWRFPWIRSSNGSPFNTSSIDSIFCAHLIEHIPHEVRTANSLPLGWRKDYEAMCDEYDGFFVFFNEVWRILKPGSTIHLRVPFGVSYDALCDPTHTRRIVPGSFSYLTDTEEDQPFDYKIEARFQMVGNILWRMSKSMAESLGRYTAEGVDHLVRTNSAEITAFDITLRAVK
jgi:predicted SAM-dependent methyltransferase